MENKKNLRIEMQNFVSLLNTPPPSENIKDVPFGKGAKYLPISYVEMKLDELYFGCWQTENFKWSGILNEVQGSIDLLVYHPVTMEWIRRTGAASIVIMVDAIDDRTKEGMSNQERNVYATSPENKKPNALDLSFPKLKAECIKNAALSLGPTFGRDLNRNFKATYTPLLKPAKQIMLNEEVGEEINKAKTKEDLKILWKKISSDQQIVFDLVFKDKEMELTYSIS